MRRALLIAVTVLAGCGTVTHPRPEWTLEAEANSGSKDLVCHEELDTGSLFSHTVCRSLDDAQFERDATMRWMKYRTSDPSSMQRGGIGGTYGGK